MIPTCPECGNPTELVKGDKIYPNCAPVHKKYFWACLPCQTWVGCHPDSKDPLGIPAGASLRKLRSQVHRGFDPLWRDKHFKSRNAAYKWLAKRLKLNWHQCHVGMFNEQQCEASLTLLQDKWEEIKLAEHEAKQKAKWEPKKDLFGD